MAKVFIVHHSADLDGFVSGIITYQAMLDSNVAKEDIVCVPYNYQPFLMYKEEGNDKKVSLFDKAQNGDRVYFVDVSWTKDTESLNKLLDKGVYIELIDHHDSSIKWYKENFKDTIEMNASKNSSDLSENEHPVSAAMLCWERFYGSVESDTASRLVKYISDYDIWYRPSTEEWEDDILAFQMGFRTLEFDMTDIAQYVNIIKAFLFLDMDDECDEYVKMGKAIIQYQKSRSKTVLKQNGSFYEIEIGGRTYKAYVGSDFCANSTLFEWGLTPEEYAEAEILIKASPVFGSTSSFISIISNRDDISAAELVKHYGGGGHQKIGGCYVFVKARHYKDQNDKVSKRTLEFQEYFPENDDRIIPAEH